MVCEILRVKVRGDIVWKRSAAGIQLVVIKCGSIVSRRALSPEEYQGGFFCFYYQVFMQFTEKIFLKNP